MIHRPTAAFCFWPWARLLLASSTLALLSVSAHASSFEDALANAYQTNPRIKAERARLESTDESLAQASSGFRPSLNATYDRGKQDTAYNNLPYRSGDYTNKSLRLEQPLFRGGGTISALRSAQQKVKAGENELSALEQQVMLDAITAYLDVVTGSTVLEIAHSNENLLQHQVNAINKRFQVGEVTRTDVAQSQSRLADAHASVVSAEGVLLNAIASFERVMGYRPEGMLDIPARLPDLPLSLEEALARGRSANPLLLAAIHAAKSSYYDVRSNQAALLPQVSLVGSLNRQDGAGAFGLDNFNQDRIGFEVRIPFYQSGAEYSRIRNAKAIARQRDQQAIDQRQEIDQSIAQAWQTYETTAAIIETRNSQIAAAEVAVGGVKQENEFGVRTVLDVLDAQQELFNARTALARAQRDRMVAAYTLALRLGQLTPASLGLNVAAYDPGENAGRVVWQPIGF